MKIFFAPLQITLVAVVSVVLGDNQFIGQRLKSKFRPRPEWFNAGEEGEELPRPEALTYDEQSDQPVIPNFPSHISYIDGYEFADSHDGGSEEGNKFQRHTLRGLESFQNLCPIIIRNVSTISHEMADKDYDYIPNRFMEFVCQEPYDPHSRIPSTGRNRICESHGNKCIQLTKRHHFTKRLRGAHGNCWESTSLPIKSDCQCMWPTNKKGLYDFSLSLSLFFTHTHTNNKQTFLYKN
jgi:hypothetical protein